MAGVDDFLALLADFDEVLATKDSKESRRECILQHFTKMDKTKCLKIPDFDSGLDWLNVSGPLQFDAEGSTLRGKVVVLDFWTYCCVNCLHVLPDLHRLEHTHSVSDGLVIVGVHSAKFLNEKVTANILSAVLRYDITHPVVNDSEATLWQKLSVVCWPTFVIVGPQGQVLYYIVGEGHSDLLFEFTELALRHYGSQGQLSQHSLPLHLERERQQQSVLSFPGKVCVGCDPGHLIVSDTGHHRVLVVDRVTGVVQTVIGGKEKGFRDGSLQEAGFNSPQGVASLGHLLFVADTENHALRQVDLSSGQVTTLAGTGSQGEDKEGGRPGPQQPLSTPWDVTIGVSPGGEEVDVVYIAMAGTHQIWAYFLKDVTWWKNKQYKAGTCASIAGSGNEENRNNSYPAKASFAQPSGLAISPVNSLNALFIADSESSTVRMLSVKDGSVKALVGGDRDPRNLFAYGDVDGAGIEAKLQHPLGVALLSPSGPLLVADSYNHKIKSVDLNSKECTTLLGTGAPGSVGAGDLKSVQLNEPGGLCVDPEGKRVYIADTNNHCIKVLDWDTKTVSQLPVILSAEDSTPPKEKVDQSALAKGTPLPEVTLQPGADLQLSLDLRLAGDLHLNLEAPNSWKLSGGDEAGLKFVSSLSNNLIKGKINPDVSSPQTLTALKIADDVTSSCLTLVLTCQVFVCRHDNTCTQERQQFVQKVNISENGATQHVTTAVVNVK